MANRGELTPKIQELAKAFLGREITISELHLYPYIHFCATNSRRIAGEKVNSEERRIMSQWKSEGHFENPMTDMNMTKEFFTYINEILWYAYFVYDSKE